MYLNRRIAKKEHFRKESVPFLYYIAITIDIL